MKMFLSIGLMSGTSMDGIDAALIRTDGEHKIEELGHVFLPYNDECPIFHSLLKAAEYVVCMNEGNIEAAHQMDFNEAFYDYLRNVIQMNSEDASNMVCQACVYMHNNPDIPITLAEVICSSTELHSKAVQKLLKVTNYRANQIDIIGYHGQTLFHRPATGITIQVGNGQELADALNIPVINDFRSRDVAHGGQGAPFAPLYHQALAIRDNLCPLAVVNCGGIANISLIGGIDYESLLGYDTGPGNGLVDLFVKQRTNFGEHMDHDGKYGGKGKTHYSIIEKLYQYSIIRGGENYFKSKPPKSLDVNDFKLIPELNNLSIEDGCATLEAFTADSIVTSLNLVSTFQPKHWVLAGGGWHNPVIRQELETRVKAKFGNDTKVHLAEEIGWNNKAMEAQIFAYLAVRSLQNQPISVPETTKVPRPLSGGHAYTPTEGVITEKVKGALRKNPDVLDGYQKQDMLSDSYQSAKSNTI
jgi:anhydro-N-acetylmuramic acid kinase